MEIVSFFFLGVWLLLLIVAIAIVFGIGFLLFYGVWCGVLFWIKPQRWLMWALAGLPVYLLLFTALLVGGAWEAYAYITSPRTAFVNEFGFAPPQTGHQLALDDVVFRRLGLCVPDLPRPTPSFSADRITRTHSIKRLSLNDWSAPSAQVVATPDGQVHPNPHLRWPQTSAWIWQRESTVDLRSSKGARLVVQRWNRLTPNEIQ